MRRGPLSMLLVAAFLAWLANGVAVAQDRPTDTLEALREKVRAELPTLLRLYRADKFLVNKIVASATAFFNEVRSDPKHPFRGEFDRMVLTFVDRLGTDQAYIDRIDGLKRDLWRGPSLQISPAPSGPTRAPSSSAAPPARHRCFSIISSACSSPRARRSPAMPNCAARSTRVW